MSSRLPRRELVDRFLSLSAGVAALSAVVVSGYQAKIAREQQRMSAWPYVQTYKSTVPGYSRVVRNVGLGPALIRRVVLTVDNRPVASWHDVALATLSDGARIRDSALFGRTITSTFTRGSVLLPGAQLDMITFEAGAPSRAAESALEQSHAVVTWICYCSFYGDCWTTSNRTIEPTSVRTCPDDDGREFRD